MKRELFIWMLCVLSIVLVEDAWAARFTSGSDFVNEPIEAERQLVVSKLSSMPLSFTENQRQFGEKTKFRCNALGASFYFAAGEVAYLFSRETDELMEKTMGPWASVSNLPDSPDRLTRPRHKREGLWVRARFVGANLDAKVVGEGILFHRSSYFLGNDPSKWRTDIPNYSAVRYREIYPGIDLKYYGDGRSLKYDFIVKPGADPSLIEIEYDGVNSLSVNSNGELMVATEFGNVIEQLPYVYQEINGDRREIPCCYVILDRNRFGLALERSYDQSELLYIDPKLTYSTYLGGSDADVGSGIAVDGEGCVYVMGTTESPDFPTTPDAYDTTYNGGGLMGRDVFVTKLCVSGDSLVLVYSTYLGGSDDDQRGIAGMAVDSSGCAYVTGSTNSNDFPTVNPYDGSFNGGTDAFVTKLSASGSSLVYSTYLGGSMSDPGADIALDDEGCAYVTGCTGSEDFPTVNAYDGSLGGEQDAFVTKLSTSGSSLVYSTYLGGSFNECGWGITVNSSGNAYVTGWTWSGDFPTTPNGYDENGSSSTDVFVTKFSISGSSLVYSTYLAGNNGEHGYDIAVDGSDCAYVTGYTTSEDFPTVNAYDGSLGGEQDAFVTKLSAPGSSLVYSTYLGGEC